MRSLFVFVAFNLFYFVIALPQFSMRNNVPGKRTLQLQRAVCVCASGCTGCSGVCCLANTACPQTPGVITNYDRCCQGDGCSSGSPGTTTSITTSEQPPTSPVTTSISTPDPPPTTPGTTTTSPAPPATPPPGSTPAAPKPTAIIAGASIGGTAGVTALSVLAFFYAHKLWYILSSLMFSVFGWWFFKGRQIILFCDKDVPETHIAIFLSAYKTIEESFGNERLLVWQRETVGKSRRGVAIFCPIDSMGSSEPKTMIGFGTIQDSGDTLTHEFHAPAPAHWKGDQFDDAPPHETSQGSRILSFTNGAEHPMRALVGTLGHTFRPFTYVEQVDPGQMYTWPSNDLYLHAFRTNSGEAREGYHFKEFVSKLLWQQCTAPENLGGLTQEDMGDMISNSLTKEQRQAIHNENLTSNGGIRVADLKPISHWMIKRDTKNRDQLRLTLVQGAKGDLH